MKRYYIFNWYENAKNYCGCRLERKNRVNITNPTGEVAIDAKRALNLFIRGFGNLKQNTIISIKEFD